MDTILETNNTVENVPITQRLGAGRPKPEWVRGKCPACDDDLVSNCYYVNGVGYLLVWECWSFLQKHPTCNYSKTM